MRTSILSPFLSDSFSPAAPKHDVGLPGWGVACFGHRQLTSPWQLTTFCGWTGSWDANAGDALPLPGRVLILDGRVLEYPHKCNGAPARPFDPLLSSTPLIRPSPRATSFLQAPSFKNRTYLGSQLLCL